MSVVSDSVIIFTSIVNDGVGGITVFPPRFVLMRFHNVVCTRHDLPELANRKQTSATNALPFYWGYYRGKKMLNLVETSKAQIPRRADQINAVKYKEKSLKSEYNIFFSF